MSQTTDSTMPATKSRLTTHATGRGKLVGHLAMLLFAALVSGSYSIGALAAPLLGPGALNTVRFMIAVASMAAAVALISRIKGQRFPAPSAPWRYLVLGGLMAVFFITMFIALRLTGPISTGAVFTLMPLMSAVFGYFLLGQVPRPIVIASLIFAALGSVWVIFNGDIDAIRSFDLGRGEMIFLIGVAAHALYSPMVKKLNDGREPLAAFTLWTMMGTGICVAVYGIWEIMETDWGSLPVLVWLAIAYLAIITGAGTTFLIQFGAMRLPAAKVMAYTYLSPSLIIVYEGLLGHGWASPSVAFGAMVTVLGLLVLALARDD